MRRQFLVSVLICCGFGQAIPAQTKAPPKTPAFPPVRASPSDKTGKLRRLTRAASGGDSSTASGGCRLQAGSDNHREDSHTSTNGTEFPAGSGSYSR